MKYTYDKNFFKVWSKDMAYILGFWFADGYISMSHKKNTSKIFGIVQATKDKYILEKIKNKIKFTGGIKEEKGLYPKSVLKIFSGEIYTDITALGGKEKKSSNVDFPLVPDEFLKSFLLGFFDGDGCISVSKKNVMRVIFTGGKSFLEEINKKLESNKILDNKTGYGNLSLLDTPNKKTYNLEYSTLAAHRVLSWFYSEISEDDLYLHRKYEKFINFKFSNKSKNKIKYKAEDEFGNTILIDNLAKFLKDNDIPESSFRKYLKNNKKYKNFLFSRVE